MINYQNSLLPALASNGPPPRFESGMRFMLRQLPTALCLAILFMPYYALTQCTLKTHLSFQNPSLVSGSDKQEGAVYRFPNVATSVDALVTIADINNASLETLDLTSTGTLRAFQPEVELLNVNSGGGVGYIDFQISFVVQGTSTPVSLVNWTATAIDVDGDNKRIRESVGFQNADLYIVETPTELSEDTGTYHHFDCASINNYAGIDTTASEHMVYAAFSNQSAFYYRTRVIDNGGTSSYSAKRKFSLNFNPCLIEEFTNTNIFPVEWLYFEARYKHNLVMLEWATARELNSHYFQIQRSSDGVNYEDIAFLQGAGNSSVKTTYSFNDRNFTSGTSYYRLKQVDLNGEFTFSNVVMVSLDNNIDFSFFPNPASDKLTIDVPRQNGSLNISLRNSAGQEVYRTNQLSLGRNWEIPVRNLPGGLYFLKIQLGNEVIANEKVIIK